MEDEKKGIRAEEQAAANYLSGFNCAQSVIQALGSTEGLDVEPLVRMVTGLGGGIARQGEACGALVAGALWLGMAWGTVRPDESRADAYRLVETLTQGFRERAGALDCAAINGTEDFVSEEHKRRCSGLCGWTARSVLELLGDEKV